MLDIRFIRENPDAVRENIRKKFQEQKLPLVDEVLALDSERRAVIAEADSLRSDRNRLSKEIGKLMGQAKKDPSKLQEAEAVKKESQEIGQRITELETEQEKLGEEIKTRMMVIPNIIDASVPVGKDDTENVEIERFGEPKVPDFEIFS